MLTSAWAWGGQGELGGGEPELWAVRGGWEEAGPVASGQADLGGLRRSLKPWPESGFPHRRNPKWDWASGPAGRAA